MVPPPVETEEQRTMNEEVDGAEEGVEKGKAVEGILPFASDSRATTTLRKRFDGMKSGELRDIKVLDLSMWTLTAKDAGEIVRACHGGLVDLTIAVLMQDGWWPALVSALKTTTAELEGIEIVGVPAGGETATPELSSMFFRQQEDIEDLNKSCPKLSRFEMSILRAKSLGRSVWIHDVASGRWKQAGWRDQEQAS